MTPRAYHGHMFRRVLTTIALSAALLPGLVSAQPAPQVAPQIFVEPGAHTAPIVSLIRSARHSIRLEVYLLTNRTIVHALGVARRRGVDVRVLLEQRPFGGSRYAVLGYNALQQAGVPVRWANEGRFTYTHAKSMEVDNTTAAILTLNFSSSGFFRNREFGVIDHNAADAQAIAAIINADWARVGPHFPTGLLVISPINSRSVFEGLIRKARHTLDLYAEEVNDAGIENALAAAVRRQVRVRLITSTSSAGVLAIQRAGVQVHLMSTPYVHAKTIMVDRTDVFIGSENISTTSLDHNREIGILLGAAQARIVESTFASDWSGRGTGNTATPTAGEPTPMPPPPLPVPSKGVMTVGVSVSPASIHRGQAILIVVVTRPHATCTIHVTYPDGFVSRSKALASLHTAGTSGRTTWSYHVGSSAAGTSTVTASCRLGLRITTGTTTFTISGRASA